MRSLEWRTLVRSKFGADSWRITSKLGSNSRIVAKEQGMDCGWWLLFPLGVGLFDVISWRLSGTMELRMPRAGMHQKGRDHRGGPRSGEAGGWRRLPKRLGAVPVGYKCHCGWHLASGRQWLGMGWALWKWGGLPLPRYPWPRGLTMTPKKWLRTFKYRSIIFHTVVVPNFAIPNFALSSSPLPPRDASEGKGPQRRPQKRLDRWLEAVTVGYKCHCAGTWRQGDSG